LNSGTIKVREGWGRVFLGAKERDAERVESTRREAERNGDAHMKEPDHNTYSTIDPGKKRKKRKGGLSFSNSKQRKRRELKKKEESYIEGRGTPSDVQSTGEESKRGSSKRQLNLQPIEEDREDSESPAASMEESEQPNSSNQSGYQEETRDDSILIVRLKLWVNEEWVFED
jgi:hypothetical protein